MFETAHFGRGINLVVGGDSWTSFKGRLLLLLFLGGGGFPSDWQDVDWNSWWRDVFLSNIPFNRTFPIQKVILYE
jgi:hypothetical protein